MEVIDGDDLRERTVELLEAAVDQVLAETCSGDFTEEWDLEQLIAELNQYYPTQFSVEDLEQAETFEQLRESVVAEALEYFDERERTFPGGEEVARQVERQVMLQIIDQRWRQHLSEMDHLREGIHLRGIAQTDPLVAWQREGFEMFGKLVDAIDDDYLRHVMHVQVVLEPEPSPDFSQASFEAADDPVLSLEPGPAGVAALGGPAPLAEGPPLAAAPAAPAEASEHDAGPGPSRQQASNRRAPAPRPRAGGPAPGASRAVAGGTPRPTRHSPASRLSGPGVDPSPAPSDAAGERKVGRNDPCWCGSGRKFKLCHGAG
ncbi:MAG: secA [Acidimicrobiaceae bacterium]|nr:secA [Acidimicrobiaceae bacterium]